MTPDPQDNRDADPDSDLEGNPPQPDAHEPVVPPLPPPPVPRPISRFVRRRAWMEPRARFWLLAAIVLTLIAGYFLLNSLQARAHEAWLIAHGVPVEATIRMANEEYVAHRLQHPDSVVMLRFTWKGQIFDTTITRLPGRKERIETGSTLPIHVNPENPDDWTWLDEPLPLLTRGIASILTLPIAALALLRALLLRGSLLRTWREGDAVEALIVSTRATGIAPRSRAAEVTPADDTENRVYTVYLPPNLADMEPGEPLYIIRRNNRSGAAIAAGWFGA